MAEKDPVEKIVLIMDSERALADTDVTVYRRYMQQYYSTMKVPEVSKCNQRSAEVRQLGNRLYLEKQFDPALEKYNEGICFAEAGSEHLSMGYANRSAIYFEIGEYEYALYNIALAKQHGYPAKLMPKLLNRESSCKEKISGGHSLETVPDPSCTMEVEANPRIPFLANGVGMQMYPGMGRGLVAQKDFQTGDLILNEKRVLATFDTGLRYLRCNYCGRDNKHSLIPCAACVWTMYCSVDCLEKDQKFTHRFECAINSKLHRVARGTLLRGSRMFFYGLTLFNDDLQAMKKYCEETADTGGDPFTLDYTRYDALAEFKELHKAKMSDQYYPDSDPIHSIRAYSAAYNLIFMEHPLVRSIVQTDLLREFMLQCTLRYNRLTYHIAAKISILGGLCMSSLSSIFCLINHSCDPNITSTSASDREICVVVRPIRKGEQIVASYGPIWCDPEPSLPYKCRCEVCSSGSIRQWFRRGSPLPEDAIMHENLIANLLRDTVEREKESLAAMKRYLDLFAGSYPELRYCKLLAIYRQLASCSVVKAKDTKERAEVAALIELA